MKWCVWVNYEHTLSVPLPENVEFSTRSDDLVDVENVLLGSSEYAVRIIGLVDLVQDLHSRTKGSCGLFR